MTWCGGRGGGGGQVGVLKQADWREGLGETVQERVELATLSFQPGYSSVYVWVQQDGYSEEEVHTDRGFAEPRIGQDL